MADWQVIEGDCVEQMAAMAEASVDAVVCDPPYAFPGGFMAKRWDNFDGRINVAFGYYLAGLIDGEGHFRVQRHERGSHTCAFALTLRSDDEATLRKAHQFLGHGSIAQLAERDRSRPVSRWTVQDKEGCAALVAMLRRFPLYAKKGQEFEVWANAVEEWHGRPRGNRWHGPSDQTQAAALKMRIERLREYRDPPWSGHRFQDWCREWGEEALRILKPGGHLVAAGAPRSAHRLAAGLEDAGFEIRDTITHLFGSGFPKSYNLPDGWGTALKPAAEFWTLARKPLAGTVAANVQAHGTGALNVDGCRIGADGGTTSTGEPNRLNAVYGDGMGGLGIEPLNAGRWPANVVLDPEAAAMLDEQTGTLHTHGNRSDTPVRKSGIWGGAKVEGFDSRFTGDSGGASRFFYCAKSSSAERNAGLDGFEAQKRGSNFGMDGARPHTADDYVYEAKDARNVHPTVKPIALMRWLVRLVTPPGGTVLDPFAGSGTTGAAAMLEGFRFVGIEREPEYAAIARARIEWWSRHPDGVEIVKALEAERERGKVRDAGQMGLFG
jgi:DNA modification methylase